MDELNLINDAISKANTKIQVDSFFTMNLLPAWNLENYNNYLKSQNRTLVFNSMKDEFKLNLDRIKKLDTLDSTIKRKIGNILTSENNVKGLKDITGNGVNSIHIGSINNQGNLNIGNISNTSNTINTMTTDDRGKKRKQTNKIDTKLFWEEWENILDSCSNRNHHKFCLEKYHVIQCGTEIKCKPYVPKNLYDHPMFQSEIQQHPFQKYGEYSVQVLERIIKKKPYSNIIDQGFNKDLDDNLGEAIFLNNYFQELSIYTKRKDTISHSEINYNYRFLWRMIDVAIDSDQDNHQNLYFKPGEVIVKIAKNAKIDALVTMYDIPLLTLETSGPFANKDNPRSGFDHIKAAFCSLSFLKNVAKHLQWGTIETFLKLKIITIHAYDNTIHMWSMRATEASNVKVYKRIDVAKIPNKHEEFTNDSLEFGNFLYTLMIELHDVQETLATLKAEHDNHTRNVLLGNSSPRTSLSEKFKFALESPDRGKGFGILLPSSITSSDDEQDEESIPPPPSSTSASSSTST